MERKFHGENHIIYRRENFAAAHLIRISSSAGIVFAGDVRRSGVGKFASSADVSAVSTGSQIMTTLTNLISSFAMGTTILLGQQIGSGKREEGGHTVGTAILLFAGIAVALSVILVAFAPQVSRAMNAPEEAFHKTVDYIRICGGGMLGVRVPVSYLVSIQPKTSLFHIGLATPMSSALQLVLCVGFMMWLNKKRGGASGTSDD